MSVVLDAGADDMKRDGDQFEILTDPSVFADVCDALETAGIATLSAEVSLVPTLLVPIEDPAVAGSVLKFVSDLEDNDDVQDVYTNMEMSDEVLNVVAAENS